MRPDTKPQRAERLPDHAPDPTVRDAKRNLGRPDDADAFLPDPLEEGRPLSSADAADAEEFIASATAGEAVDEDARDEVLEDEEGGPFLLDREDREVDLPADAGEPDLEPGEGGGDAPAR